jgi:hypothetical protein
LYNPIFENASTNSAVALPYPTDTHSSLSVEQCAERRARPVSLKMISSALIVSETCGNLVSVQLFSIVRDTICASTFLIGFVGHAA